MNKDGTITVENETVQPTTVRRPPCRTTRSFDARDWVRVYQLVLASSGIGVIVCDSRLRILALSPSTRRTLQMIQPGTTAQAGGELPGAVAALVPDAREAALLGEKPKAVPLQTELGQVFYLTFAFPTELPFAPVVITVRRGEQRGSELMGKLRKRFQLTSRECQLVELLRQGRTNRQIAETLNLTEGTVKNYVYFLFQKLDIPTRSALPSLLEQIKNEE